MQKRQNIFIVAGVLIALVAGIFVWFYVRDGEEGQPQETQERQPTQEETVQSLTAPSDVDVRNLAPEEKKQILDSLTAPKR